MMLGLAALTHVAALLPRAGTPPRRWTRRESMLEEAPRRATDARAGRRATAETVAVARETRGAHAWAMAMCDDVV